MELPVLISKASNIGMLNAFAGYNHNLRIRDGEFYDMKNLTADNYPVLSIRDKRAVIDKLEAPMGIYGGRNLVYVDGNQLFYNQNLVCELKEEFNGRERKFATMGAFLCVFPDKITYNTYTGEIEEMENTVTTTEPPTFTLCKLDETEFTEENTYTGDSEPNNEEHKYWIDTSAEPVVIKMWSENTSEWASVGTTYVKVASPGIGAGFKEYDAVTFEDVDDNEHIYNGYDFNQSNILYKVSEDYVVITGFINRVFTNSKNITLKRTVPDMDFVAEMDNRIWGCSSENHEVYACKLGDPKNWHCYMGLSSDSYAATIGTDGDFTGAINYRGTVYFFKDKGVHSVQGTKPSNYQVGWKTMRGVQKGSEKSLVVLNEYLFFKSRDGVCVFDGSMSENISEEFGRENYYDAVAGAYLNKYYISMRNEGYEYSMFVYDSKKGIWMREDNTIAKGFAYANGGLYLINQDNILQVINKECVYNAIFPQDERLNEVYWYPGEDIYPGYVITGEVEDDIEWMAETGEYGLDSPGSTYIKRFILRMMLGTGAVCKVEAMYDSSGIWEPVMEYHCTSKRSIKMPLKVRRCDHMRLRFSGHGEIHIFSNTKVTEEGS